MTTCLLIEETVSIVSAVLDNEWLLTLYTQSYTHFYLGKSLKLIWEKFRVFWTVLIESLSGCVCVSELKLNMCARTHTHTHTHTHTVWLSLRVCLVIPYHLPRQQCLSFVCLHFSLFLSSQKILHFISSIKVFPQERIHADKRSTDLTATLCLWSVQKISSPWKNACHCEGKP